MDILLKITKLRTDRKWTEYALAEKSGVPQSTISSWYKKNMLPSFSSLEKICNGFGITLSQFFADSDDLVELTPEQKKLLSKWDVLSGDQKRTLIEFLKTI